MNAEQQRLAEACQKAAPWKKWGPYLSERQWGTVREDYSDNGDAWNYFSHDQARSRAYRWGEDGLGGICDDHQVLCFALALWNGRDPILKERLFGLTNSEGNHGEDVKEYYFYLDSTPTHSYMKYLYKYPQAAYPYVDLGLDNIGVFDRSSQLPTGGSLEQADGTAWMVFYSQQMLRIAVELALHDRLYEEFVCKFFQHTVWLPAAMDRVGEHHDEMWEEEDGYFYDVLRLPDGNAMRLKVRSMVGLLPLAAVAIFEEDILERLTGLFVRDKDGRRAVYGGAQKFQSDPHWRDLILFYEYFDGDAGRGIGASHQTGWTGCVARMIQASGSLTRELLLSPGAEQLAIRRAAGEAVGTLR